MPSLATLSILRLPDSYLFQFQPVSTRQPATLLTAVQPLPAGQSALPQQIEETIRLLNRLIVQRQARVGAKPNSQPASSLEIDLLQSLGRLLYNQLLPPAIQQALHTLPNGAPLLLMTNHAELPWELLHDGEQFLATKHLISRQMLVDTSPRLHGTRPQRLRTALLIGNPTGDLPEAEEEIEELLALLETLPDMAVPVVLMQTRASKDAVLKHLVSGEYDLIHYSGHAFFDPAQPQASGLALAHNTHLTATEIRQNLAGQPMVFLNACESARSLARPTPGQSANELAYLGMGIEGLASAFLQGGAQGFIGTFWPIADTGSQAFALAFHRATLQGETIGAALHQARLAHADPTDPLWVSYVLYGDPTLSLVPAATAKAQPATVLAVHLRGLNPLLTDHTPEAAGQALETYLLGLTQAIQRCGGQVYSTTHHLLLAIFGIPHTQENDAERAVHAALAMLTAPSHPTLALPQLTCSIGLATGDVLVNPLPATGVPLPLVTGQVVETALQLAEQAAPGEILIAPSTRRLTRTRFQLAARSATRTGPTPAYRVLGHLAEVDPFWSLPEQQLPMIGRQTEFAALQEAWRRSCQGQGQIVDIVGEAGVGKSRLVQAFHASVGEAAQWLVVASPSAYAVGAYWLIGQLVRLLLQVTPDVAPAVVQRKLEQVLGQYAPDSLAVISDVLGLNAVDNAVRHLDSQIYQRQLSNGLEQWLVQKAVEKPLVIVLEDFHRVDEASQAILKLLAPLLAQAPILLIALFRTEGDWQSPWGRRRNQRELTVQALDATEGQQFVAALLQAAEVAPEIARIILEPAEGNPFFMRELVFSLREAQALRLEQGVWQLARVFQAQDIPDSLERLIRLRISSITETAQRVLALLAVAGDSCEAAILTRAVAGAKAEANLESSLEELIDKDLISQRWAQGKQRYHFPHALIQSVVYESLHSEERRRYHRRVRLALEQVYQGREADSLELLAHHAYQSVTLPGMLGNPASVAAEVSQGDLARTASYLERSGTRANQRYAARQAIRYYQQAIQVSQPLEIDGEPLRATCYEGIGDAYELLGDYAAAIKAYQAALNALANLAQTTVTRRRASDLLRRLGRLSGWLSEFTQAHRYMQQALQLLGEIEESADRAIAALIYTHSGSLYYLQGQLEAAAQACQQALRLVDEQAAAEVAATTFNVFGVICEVTGQWAQAVNFYERSRDIWARLDRRHPLAQVMDNLGTLYFYRGDFVLAEQHYRQNLAFWEKMEARDNLGYAALNLGSIYLHRGQGAQAESYYQQALAAFQETHNQKLAALTHNNLGFLELSRGNAQAALAYFEQSIAEDPSAENYRGLSEAEERLGCLDQALAHAQKSLDLARASDLAFEAGVTLRRLGCHYLARGNCTAARLHLVESLTILRNLGARYELARTLCQLGLLAGRPVTEPELRAYLVEALTIFGEVGAEADALCARQALEEP